MRHIEAGTASSPLLAEGEAALLAAIVRAQGDLGLGLVVVEGERIARANDAFGRMAGRTPEELVALPSFFDLVPPELQERLRRGWELRLAGRTRKDTFEAELQRPGGERVEVEVAVKTLDQGPPLRLVAVVRDVTARRAAERAQAELLRRLEEERLMLACVVQSIPDAVYVGDARGIRLANRAALDQLGFDRVEELNAHIAELAERIQTRYADSLERIAPEEEVFVRALRGETSVRDVVVRHLKTGQDRIVRSAAAPVEVDDRIVAAVAVNTDVTEARQTEEELRRANKRLQELGEARTQFFNAVAHELRTPLTPIVLQLELLRRAPLDPQQRAKLDIVDRAVARLQRLLDDVLDAARVERGGFPVRPEEVDLVRVVREAERAFEPVARKGGLRLTVDAPERLELRADPHRLSQVFYNLLSNAVKFTPAGGEVSVAVRALDGLVRVEVRDSGEGLPPGAAERLFRPFSQVSGSRRRHGGAGLGLFISKGIVEKHGGRIGASSEGEGRGTTFWFTLPLTEPRG